MPRIGAVCTRSGSWKATEARVEDSVPAGRRAAKLVLLSKAYSQFCRHTMRGRVASEAICAFGVYDANWLH
jgi:hypothetical protein